MGRFEQEEVTRARRRELDAEALELRAQLCAIKESGPTEIGVRSAQRAALRHELKTEAEDDDTVGRVAEVHAQ
jgi:hypothetical protein